MRDADRRAFLKHTGALGAGAVLLPSLASCGPESTIGFGDPAGADRTLTAVIGYGNDGSWDPTQTASAFFMAANHHVCEGLLDTDPISREPYPALATGLPGPRELGGTTWRFTLREGATFHDGRPVTADDVVFTFDRILDPDTRTLARGFFAGWLDTVRGTGARGVELVLKFPFPDGMSRLTLAKIMPRHVCWTSTTVAAWPNGRSGSGS
ncbi:ABC transporter substrate-binding protein [Streptomyces lincolnensis]|uniref:ABC transporter substrate-binding protein n=1 Tax=Streptomyces lincolnensis TaxID=1915 RepID=A0A1B1M926_STRLN|nr:ABC transporter substrate-binding protein [Streptomyces lincolnensis]AXG56656.1 ABC transporter substrate-binding protein [Streptomyces lincolnensis]QMV06917.1 twin-arginine translocation signal domain-containing protein [Streptomyces lincolnensis]